MVNIVSTLNRNRATIIYFINLILAYCAIKLAGPVFFATNDDGIMVHLVSSKFDKFTDSNMIYGSHFYSIILNFMYTVLPSFQWHGIILFLTTWLAISVLLSDLIKHYAQYRIEIIVTFSIILIYYLTIVLSPTFTTVSLTCGLVAVCLLYSGISYGHLSRTKLIIVSILLCISYLIRPDGIIFIIAILIFSLIFIFSTNKFGLRNLFSTLISTVSFPLIFFTYESIYKFQLIRNNSEWRNYFSFLDPFHSVDTNPAMLKLHQAVASFEIPNIGWTNVEATLLHSVAYLDINVFSPERMQQAVMYVDRYVGVKGLFNTNIIFAIERMWEYMDKSLPILLIVISLAIYLLFVMRNKDRILITVLIYLPVFFFYYYLAAVLRIPQRINLPILTFLIIIMIIILFNKKDRSTLFNKFLFILVFVIFVFFQIGQNGLFSVFDKNTSKVNISADNDKVFSSIDPKGIFIGQIQFGPENFTKAYSVGDPYSNMYISTGWQVFSPPWFQSLKQMGIPEGNPYLAVAQKGHTYWVSSEYIASVLEMYMNDQGIERNNLCKLANLPEGGAVFTFQATDTNCTLQN